MNRNLGQLAGALTLLIATYYGMLRIAEGKCEAAIGAAGVSLQPSQVDDFAAFVRLRSHLHELGQTAFSDRLDQLRQRDALFVAPALGPERWAAYVEALGLVKRIYIRRQALRDPIGHLYAKTGPGNTPPDFQSAFARLSLAGALRHELAHYEGAIEESAAYREELAWYDEVRKSPFVAGLDEGARAAWDWAFESAILSAQKAAKEAAAS